MREKYSCGRESMRLHRSARDSRSTRDLRALLERVGTEVPPTMQPHFPFVVPELSYLKFGTIAVSINSNVGKNILIRLCYSACSLRWLQLQSNTSVQIYTIAFNTAILKRFSKMYSTERGC